MAGDGGGEGSGAIGGRGGGGGSLGDWQRTQFSHSAKAHLTIHAWVCISHQVSHRQPTDWPTSSVQTSSPRVAAASSGMPAAGQRVVVGASRLSRRRGGDQPTTGALCGTRKAPPRALDFFLPPFQ